jgi:hypothetical protein
MKRKIVVDIIASIFIIFFTHSAIGNYIGMQSLKNLLGFYTPHVSEIAWCIVIIEAVIATLLVISRTRLIGLLLTFIFMIFLAITVWMTPNYPHDFGGILNDKPGKLLVLFAGIGIVFAVLAVWLGLKIIKNKTRRSKEVSVIYT